MVARSVAAAHDEDAHRWISFDAGWLVLQPAVEPAQAQVIEGRPSAAVEGRARTEIHVAGVRPVTAVVDPRTKDQPQGRLAAVDQARVDLAVDEGEGVVPAAAEDRRHVRKAVEVCLEVDALLGPERVIRAMGGVGEEGLLERGDQAERRAAPLDRAPGDPIAQVLGAIGNGAGDGRVVERLLAIVGVQDYLAKGGQLEGSALASAVGEQVVETVVQPHCCQMRRLVQGQRGLDDGAVGDADGADAPVRPRLSGDPLDGVVAVRTLMRVDRVVVLTAAL